MTDVCKDCTERHIKCHADCQRYLDAKKQHEEERDRIKAIKSAGFIIKSHKREMVMRAKKRNK